MTPTFERSAELSLRAMKNIENMSLAAAVVRAQLDHPESSRIDDIFHNLIMWEERLDVVKTDYDDMLKLISEMEGSSDPVVVIQRGLLKSLTPSANNAITANEKAISDIKAYLNVVSK